MPATALLRSRRFAPLFATQLLGALNDNLFKSALVMTLTFGLAGRLDLSVDAMVNLATALLILPFFLFSAVAGQLADKLEKSRLIRALKVAEVVVMLVAAAAFLTSNVPLLMGTLFLMGTQSAFFGPVKYGILPQHLREGELLAGNGLVEMGTFVAILAGTIAGGLLIAAGPVGHALVPPVLVAVAAAGWVASRRIPLAAAADPDLRIDWNVARATRETLGIARRDTHVIWSILGASWFWFFGALFLTQFPVYAREVLGGNELVVTWLLAIFSIGIGVGSVACEKVTRGRVELALVPLAGLAMTALALDLALASTALPTPLVVRGPAEIPLRIVLDLFLLGAAGGLFIVPLYAEMQRRAHTRTRSRVIAANNVVNALFMVVAAGFAVGLRAAGLTIPELFLVVAIINGVIALGAAIGLRRWLVRLLAQMLVRTLYRVQVQGVSRIPQSGPALLVCNHPSFADALILGGLCPRPVRFVVYHRIFHLPVLRWFFRLVRAIPIAPRREDAPLMDRAFEDMDRALRDGELVAIFPEGKVTRDGEMNPFRPGVERILARRPVPVVPIALRGMWGSFFSWAGGPPMKKAPRRLWSRIELVAGEVLAAPAAADVALLRARVLDLRGDRR